MSLDKSILITSSEGHEYVLGFSLFNSFILPETITQKIIEVVIAIEDNKGVNNAKTLFSFAKHIKSYLFENDVILYSYCDSKAIERSEKHQHLSPQAYRSLLFQMIFDREAGTDFINRPVELTDGNNENHFIHLFSTTSNVEALEVVCKELYKLNK